jgi:tetratricopeptide (TPR) repeat protein
MSQYSAADIAHTASTDHRILRRPRERRAGDQATALTGVRSFFGTPESQTPEDRRDLGIALAHSSVEKQALFRLTPAWEELLDSAVARHPDDLDAWEAKGVGAIAMRKFLAAEAAFSVVLARAPTRESALIRAALLAQQSGQLDKAADYWQRAASVNPWQPQYHANLARLAQGKKDWTSMRGHVNEWLKLDPASVEARKMRLERLIREGDQAEAAAEFSKIEKLKPKDLDELRIWFKQQTKE